ncbi:MAG: hypothetical protein IH977_08135 [Nitrospinae bacterium]|nr:hypothetical protein [Nitrospinota bacterium]
MKLNRKLLAVITLVAVASTFPGCSDRKAGVRLFQPGFHFIPGEISSLAGFRTVRDSIDAERGDTGMWRTLLLSDGQVTLRVEVAVVQDPAVDMDAFTDARVNDPMVSLAGDLRFVNGDEVGVDVGDVVYVSRSGSLTPGGVEFELFFITRNVYVSLIEEVTWVTRRSTDPLVAQLDLLPIAREIDSEIRKTEGVSSDELASLQPTIREFRPAQAVVEQTEVTEILLDAVDPGGSPLQYFYRVQTGEVVTESGTTSYFSGPKVGTQQVSVTAVSTNLLFTVASMDVEVVPVQ